MGVSMRSYHVEWGQGCPGQAGGEGRPTGRQGERGGCPQALPPRWSQQACGPEQRLHAASGFRVFLWWQEGSRGLWRKGCGPRAPPEVAAWPWRGPWRPRLPAACVRPGGPGASALRAGLENVAPALDAVNVALRPGARGCSGHVEPAGDHALGAQ